MSVPTEFIYLLDEVKVFKRNLVKDNTERRGNQEYCRRKLNKYNNYKLELGTIRDNFNKNLRDPKLIKSVREYIGHIERYLKACYDILQSRLEDIKNSGEVSESLIPSDSDSEYIDTIDKFNLQNMSEKFDAKTASSLLPIMDGSENATLQLINGIEWYNAILDEAGKLLLTTYVLKTRLSGSAKIRLKSSYASNDLLVTDLRLHFTTKKSATALSSKLNNIKQGQKSVEEFGKTIEELMTDLTISQSGGDSGVADILRPVNEKIAINSFANGLQNYELRTIVKARNYDTLSEAICGAKDEDSVQTNVKPLFHMRGRGNFSHYQNYRNNNSRRGQLNDFRNNRGRNNIGFNNNNFRGNFFRGQISNNNFRGRGSYSNNYFVPRGQFTTRGRFFSNTNRNNSNQRGFYMNNEGVENTQNISQNNRETFFRDHVA